MMLAGLAAAWAPIADPAAAQGLSGPQLLGGIMRVLAIADRCAVPMTSERRSELARAGGRIAAGLGLGPDELDRLRQDMDEDLRAMTCGDAQERLDGVAADLLDRARRLR